MELNKQFKHKLEFHGEGSKLFGISIVNAILTMITLGFYYPWAKVAKLHYLYHETELAGSRFEFHGNGKELFKGFIKALLVIAVAYVCMVAAQFVSDTIITIVLTLFAYVIFAFIIPIAIHGAARYRLSRTSWRGIHFGYRGNRKEFIALFLKGMLLSIVTLGIYVSWFTIHIRKYVIDHIRFGNIKFKYYGNGSEYFWLRVEGIFFCIITLGIYIPWYIKNLTDYYIKYIQLEQDGKFIQLQSGISGIGYFKLFFTNFALVLFTLGIASPWAEIRTLRYIISNVTLEGDIDLDNILQTEEDYTNATGDDLVDMLDIDLI